MGDRHGGRFARRGRTLSPPRPQVDAHRGVGFRHSARAKRFAPRRNAPLGEGFPTRRTSERICPRENAPLGEGFPTRRTSEGICLAQEHAPSAKASQHGARAKEFAHARTLSSAKASRHGARAKGFAPRRNTPHGEGLPTRRTSERICPSGFAFAPRADERRAAPDRRTAGKTPLRRGRTRHGARAKGFVPRRNTPLGEGLPTRRTSERVCPTQKRSPRRRPPDTAHERKDLPAQEHAPRRRPPDTAHERKNLPRGVRVRPTCRRTAGRPRPTDSRKTPLRRGRTHSACGHCRVHSPKKNKTTP